MSISLYAGECLQAELLDSGIAEIRLDRKLEAVNKLDAHLLQELDQVLGRLSRQTALRGLLINSAKDAFLAGADIVVLWSMLQWPQQQQLEFCRGMQQSLTAISELPVPVACAINGYALGGGLEVALCADYRVLAADGQVGFPEVGLGILPGAGGTVRMPRLCNAATALEWIVGARAYKASAALNAGVVDAVGDNVTLRDMALDWLGRAIGGELDWKAVREQRKGSFQLDDTAFNAARVQAHKTSRNQPAALTVVELLQDCAPLSRDAAFSLEALAFARLIQSPAAKALVGTFLTGQQLKKRNRNQAASSRHVRRVGVLGAGIMGGGIAYASAVKGMPVLLKDVAQQALDLGTGEASKLLAKQVDAGRLQAERADSIFASISAQLDFKAFETVDVVVEAVVEDLRVKQAVFAEMDVHVLPGTVLASNTSSLLIRDIRSPVRFPPKNSTDNRCKWA